jgi:hypothetical protein
VIEVVLSLQPNHPGVWQVVVAFSSEVVVVVLGTEVLSLHPHQPGVSQVEVRVRDLVEEETVEVVGVELLLW